MREKDLRFWRLLEYGLATIDELYDVAVLPRVRAAEAIGFKSDDIQREITVE